MKIKARLPLIIMTFGIVAAIVESGSYPFLMNSIYIFKGLVILIVTGAICYSFEKLKMNDVEIHLLTAVLIVMGGIMVDSTIF
ncbi:hypothetical protein [Halobacillus amylolyticus]|uniref:Uncharacterized protein n=1 Tax=Halobacillus amylolyticus TaxID=2932259 RepID=A0ABY4H8D5_9BACI|nr:hypothetical protein [Halobacillus amylolyticus]UOR10964.1 hypothetical protein MUO15_15330 [Halobacillus amylolyticus]